MENGQLTMAFKTYKIENLIEVDIEFIIQYASWVDDNKLFEKSLSKQNKFR